MFAASANQFAFRMFGILLKLFEVYIVAKSSFIVW